MKETTSESATPVYPVSDVKASVAWYVETLGFELEFLNEPEGQPAVYAVLFRDRLWIHLCRVSEGVQPASEYASAQLHVRDVNEHYELLRSRGARVLQEIGDRFWGARDFVIADPGGNQLWFSEPIE